MESMKLKLKNMNISEMPEKACKVAKPRANPRDINKQIGKISFRDDIEWMSLMKILFKSLIEILCRNLQ